MRGIIKTAVIIAAAVAPEPVMLRGQGTIL
jgi:hypothetical protein